MATGNMTRGTVLAVLVLGVAYVARIPAEALAVGLVGDRANEGGDPDWVPALASAAVIAVGLGVAGAILSHYRPDPAAQLARWAASAGLRRVPELEGALPGDVRVTRLLRRGRRWCLAAFEGEAPMGRVELRVITARGPRSWFPLGTSDDSPPRTVTQVAVVGLGQLATFTIEPQGWVPTKDKRRRAPTVSTESIEFGTRWLLRGESPRDIHACLAPSVMARLMQDDAEGLVLEWSPGALLTAVGGVLGVGHQLERRLTVLHQLVHRVPAYLTTPQRT